MVENSFITKSEAHLATVTRFFASEGATKEVTVLANSIATVEQTDYDNWNGRDIYLYTLYLQISIPVYIQIERDIEVIQTSICNKLKKLISNDSNCYYSNVYITAKLSEDLNWRDKAKKWLSGSNINNQGKVRSDNIASRAADGLLFRSSVEILFYRALKSLGVSFAPLPVFIRGGSTYQRIEPDFFIVKDGVMLVVEIDGDTVHQETPAEAHARTIMLLHEGVHFERIKASECDNEEKALISAKKIIMIIEKHKATR